MRILFLVTKWPPIAGGAGKIAYNIANAAVERGHTVKVLTQWFPGLPEKEEQNGLEIERIKVPRIFKTNFLTDFGYLVSSMARKISTESKNFDVVHAHDVTVGVGMYAAAKLSKFNSVFKYGGDLVYEFTSMRSPKGWDPAKGDVASWNFDFLSKVAYRTQLNYMKKFSLVYSNSSYSYNLLKDKMGIEKSKWKGKSLRKKLLIPEDSKVILCSSRLVPAKGVNILIDAFNGIEGNNYLVIVGDGPQRKVLENLAANDKRIKFVGNISIKDMPNFYAAADIFVLPSFFDWAPNSLLEAMAMGKICVATKAGGVPEMIDNGENGFLSLPGDRDSLHRALEKALVADRKAFGTSAIRKIHKEFTIEQMVDNTLALYEQFAKK